MNDAIAQVIRGSCAVRLLRPMVGTMVRWIRTGSTLGRRVARQWWHDASSLEPVRAFGVVLVTALVAESLTRMAVGRPLAAWGWRLGAVCVGTWSTVIGGSWRALCQRSLLLRLLGYQRESSP